jgi:pimeloyl-ACP methyl ester carboxylesterase
MLAACAYLGITVVLMFFENYLVYHPITARSDWMRAPNSHFQDVDLPLVDGTHIHAWWRPCPGANEAVLYCHGNAGNLSHRGDIVEDLQNGLQQSVLIFDYPGFGKSEGAPSEQSCYAAADAAYDWLTATQGIPWERIVLLGKSLGGGVAVDLASRRSHRALALFWTFTSIPDVAQESFFWLPVRWLARNRFESLGKLDKCTRPIFIAHGMEDRVVPFKHGQRLHEMAPGPKQFVALKGVGHDGGLDKELIRKLGRFLEEQAPLARSQAAAPN